MESEKHRRNKNKGELKNYDKEKDQRNRKKFREQRRRRILGRGHKPFPLQENLDGVTPRFPQIGIIHRAQMFDMPGLAKVSELTGIILDTNNVNAYWKTPFQESGGGTPPDCFSRDGITPEQSSSELQSDSCYNCPQNQWGSEIKDGTPGNGKACKNMKRVHVMLENELAPFRLTLPPSSIMATDNYIFRLTSKGLPYQIVNTIFRLKESKNKQGISYSEIVFDAGETISRDMMLQVKRLRDEYLSAMREQYIDPAEFYGDNDG
ncbi:MAG: hypothetical protein KJN62_02530 [Deltaproteobacteria bacterium]|nr:hypothetical protein [Deltaproteobacteria bacterium]